MFAEAALGAGEDLDKKHRNQANARKGYDFIVSLSKRLTSENLSDADMQQFEQNVRKLKSALEELGESFS